MKTVLAAVAVSTLALGAATAAQATVRTYTFDQTNVGGFGAGPYGEVKVDDAGGILTVDVSPNAIFKFHESNGTHHALAFELNPDVVVTLGNLTAGFSRAAGTNLDAPPFGNNVWDVAIDCTGCGAGFGGGIAGPLHFTITGASALTVNSLGMNNGVYFVSDFVNRAGNTGNVGAGSFADRAPPPPPAVPEPATWALMIGGFGLAGAALRRRAVLSA